MVMSIEPEIPYACRVSCPRTSPVGFISETGNADPFLDGNLSSDGWHPEKNRHISSQRGRVAQRKLRQVDIATELRDLASPPGNHLEMLRGDRAGEHSVRINGQWRICFVWRSGDAYDVEIVDYH
jgi:toxin HigB-1